MRIPRVSHGCGGIPDAPPDAETVLRRVVLYTLNWRSSSGSLTSTCLTGCHGILGWMPAKDVAAPARRHGKLGYPLPFETALKVATDVPADRLAPPNGKPKHKARPKETVGR